MLVYCQIQQLTDLNVNNVSLVPSLAYYGIEIF